MEITLCQLLIKRIKEPQLPINKTVGISWLFHIFLTLIEYHAANNVYIATMTEHLVNSVILE